MQHFPEIERFRELARDFGLVPVCRRMLSDSLTPVTAFHRIDDGKTACLFESVIGGEKVGRYSFLAVEPFLELSARGRKVNIRSASASDEFDSPNPLDELRKRINEVRAAHLPELPPFTGARSAMRVTMSFAMSRTCLMLQKTTENCRTCRSRSTIEWSFLTT